MATTTRIEATGVGTIEDGWVLTAGANKWVAVNSPSDDSTTYISTNTNDNQYFTKDALPAAANIINSVSLVQETLKDGSGNPTTKASIHDLTVETVGTERANTTSWVETETLSVARPDGGGAWQPTYYDSCEIGIKATSNPAGNLHCTMLYSDVNWDSAAGSFAYVISEFVTPWVLPLIGLGSMTLREIFEEIWKNQNAKMRPGIFTKTPLMYKSWPDWKGSRGELREIQEELRRLNTRYLYVGT
jgi:hypothetical protein